MSHHFEQSDDQGFWKLELLGQTSKVYLSCYRTNLPPTIRSKDVVPAYTNQFTNGPVVFGDKKYSIYSQLSERQF